MRFKGTLVEWNDDRGFGFIQPAEEVLPAARVSAQSSTPAPPGAPHPLRALVVSILFVLSLVVWTVAGRLSALVPAWYVLASLIAFVAYWLDKADAQRGRWRTPESTLQGFALVGGWPGAWIAQQALRHKSRKTSFQATFRACVVLNLGALAWTIWSGGRWMVMPNFD